MLLSLRFHDTERTKVSRHLSTNVSQTNSIYEGHDALGSEGGPMETRPSAKGLDAHGFLSPVAKLYLADVNGVSLLIFFPAFDSSCGRCRLAR
jgi:hypothetical protein